MHRGLAAVLYGFGANTALHILGLGVADVNRCTPTLVGGAFSTLTILQMYGSWSHQVAVGSDGRAYAWGGGATTWELGTADTVARWTPTLFAKGVFSTLRGIVDVKCGPQMTMALTNTGGCLAPPARRCSCRAGVPSPRDP